jgi:hypothetical protein
MKIEMKDPPREFVVGHGSVIRMKDCARVELEPDEQVTFTTEAGGEYDVARKSWGFYATPSTNARLARFGLRAALAKSWENKYFVYLVERGREGDFQRYLDRERNRVVAWLDTDEACAALDHVVERAPE